MATLPHFLFDSHKHYKEDTNQVVTWLAETAQKFGHPLKVETPATRPSGRLKGKARKKARENAMVEGTETINSAVRYTVTVNEFTDLAHHITNQKPTVKVPFIIVGLLRRAIALRKHCADWFLKKATTEEGMIDNSKHWHFIGVLERVLHILEPNSVSASKVSAHQTKIGEKLELDSDKSVNIYDVLYIDDNDSGSTEVTTVTPQKTASCPKVSSPPRRTVYEMEITEEDAYFALFCFFDDLNQLRDYLFELWRDYDDGKLNLMSVSVTTNMAINLVRRTEQDLIATFPILKSFDEISNLLDALLHEIRG